MQEMSNMGMGLSIHEQEHKDPEVRQLLPNHNGVLNNLSNPYPRLLLTSAQLEMSKSGINNWKN